MRQYFAAGLLLVGGLLLLWIGFSGHMGLVLGALLCPGQLTTDNPENAAAESDLTRALPTQSGSTITLSGGGGGTGYK